MFIGAFIGCAVLWGCFVDCQGMFYGLSSHEEVLAASLLDQENQIGEIGEALVFFIAALQELSLFSFQHGWRRV
jgi:hypothetical protein